MSLTLLAFLAGILSALAPCVLPILPVILGSSLGTQSKRKPFIIVGSTAVFIVIFTVLLKASSVLISVPQSFWVALSGSIIFLYGLSLLWPAGREKCAQFLGVSRVNILPQKAKQITGIWGDILLGASLGPIFASCSPTYALLLSLIFPENFSAGILYTIVYAVGFGCMLLCIAYGGRSLVAKLRRAANPHGIFKKVLGGILIVTGILIASGTIKKIETRLVEHQIFDATRIEQKLLERNPDLGFSSSAPQEVNSDILNADYPAPELIGVENRINTENGAPLTLSSLRNKVVIIDFRTYSCINCIRTLPFLQQRHQKYAEKGLVIIGVHAPEFQFEKLSENLKNAVQKFGISYPVVQDNDFLTRRAYRNQYRPAKYIIDKSGNVRYKHFGEGAYEETENVIRTLLGETGENNQQEQMSGNQKNSMGEQADFKSIGTAETYLGTERREISLGRSVAALVSTVAGGEKYPSLPANSRFLSGTWHSEEEYVELKEGMGSLFLNFKAKTVKLVMGSSTAKDVPVDVYKDGMFIETIVVNGHQLYTVYTGDAYTRHTIELRFPSQGVQAYAFTFG